MKRLFSVFGWISLLAFGLVACGSDDDDDGGGSSSASAAVASCNSYCDKDAAAMCGVYTSADECKMTECDASGASAACADKIKAYYDCQNALADVCDFAGCTTEFDAIIDAC